MNAKATIIKKKIHFIGYENSDFKFLKVINNFRKIQRSK